MILHTAADGGTPPHAVDTLATYLVERWGVYTIVREASFNRKLFLVRRRAEKALGGDPTFYMPSLSATTLVVLIGNLDNFFRAIKAWPEQIEPSFGPWTWDSSRAITNTITDIVEGLHQLPRHRSIHVGGFVLTAQPLSTVVPIEPASMADRTVIQWDKNDIDDLGFVKVDLDPAQRAALDQYVRETAGGSAKIVVPESASVSTLVPGTRDQLVVGAPVNLTHDPSGVALRIQVGPKR